MPAMALQGDCSLLRHHLAHIDAQHQLQRQLVVELVWEQLQTGVGIRWHFPFCRWRPQSLGQRLPVVGHCLLAADQHQPTGVTLLPESESAGERGNS
jgi:hypothetical protein